LDAYSAVDLSSTDGGDAFRHQAFAQGRRLQLGRGGGGSFN
jgi:hypothetical protein